MNRGLILVVALAFALVAVVGCQANNVGPTVSDNQEQPAAQTAETAIDANVVAENDTVELGELV